MSSASEGAAVRRWSVTGPATSRAFSVPVVAYSASAPKTPASAWQTSSSAVEVRSAAQARPSARRTRWGRRRIIALADMEAAAAALRSPG
ncbi:hypothetical protein ACIBCA_29610 [Kitasatospora sp. NPDC051170]|uniref:hypothetical protein n=1 Tax=Kitasatospora sp. NPDC051170 TaxID=3364056 RepID=UPI0037BA70AB